MALQCVTGMLSVVVTPVCRGNENGLLMSLLIETYRYDWYEGDGEMNDYETLGN